MTSTSVGWVLLDGQGPDAEILDHDAFDIQSAADGAEGGTSPHAAAARGAQAIAAASGHKVGSVQVTWTEDVEAGGTALLKSLADLGFDNVHPISVNKAAQAWGIEVGRESEHTKTGLCILEPDVATILIVATGAGTVRTAVTDTRESAEDLVEWLRTVFRKDGWLPESLYLVGAHADLDEVTQPIADALPIAVSDSVDTQLALARGAALTTVNQVDTDSPQAAEPPTDKPWRLSLAKKPVPAPAAEETVVAATISQADTAATQVIEKPRTEPKVERSTRERPWLVAHAKKLTIGAAAVAVFGAALSLAAGSAFNVDNTSAQAADPALEGAAETSVSIHTIPPQPAPNLQPLAAEPPPAPPPPVVPPPPPLEPLPPPAEPVASVAPQPIVVPQPTVTAVPHAVAPAPSSVAPAPASVAPAPASVAPAPSSVAAAPAPVALPPAAPLAAPVAPPPAAAPAQLPPPAAAPAPVAPPPGAPAPIVPPPPPGEPAEPPPPPDPLQQLISGFFGSLP